METKDNSETARPSVAAPEVDQVERLSQALAQFATGDQIEVELYRVIGTGRGVNGEHEFIESLQWDTADGRGIGAVIRDVLNHLRDAHGGGRFRLQIRDDQTGQLRMNQAATVIQKLGARQAPPATEKPDGLALLLAQQAEDRKAADARFEKLLATIAAGNAKPEASEDEMLDRMAKYKTLFGGNDKGTDLLDALDKVMGIRERFDNLGAKEKPDQWAELIRDFGPDLLAAMRGGGEAEDAGTDADEAVRNKLASFAGMMVKAAEQKVAPAAAAQFALARASNKGALVKFCQNPEATSLLCQAAPELVRYVVWVEQVRAEVVKTVTAKLPAPVAKEEGKPRADDAGDNSGRAGGRGGNPEKNAAASRGGKAPANAARGGTKAGKRPAAKGLPKRGGKAARVRT